MNHDPMQILAQKLVTAAAQMTPEQKEKHFGVRNIIASMQKPVAEPK